MIIQQASPLIRILRVVRIVRKLSTLNIVRKCRMHRELRMPRLVRISGQRRGLRMARILWILQVARISGQLKSFARKSGVKVLGVHNHDMNDGYWNLYREMSQVTGRHFSVTVEADLQRRRHSSRGWVLHGDGTIEALRNCGKTFFRAVTDRTLQAGFAHQLRHQMRMLLSSHVERGHPEEKPHLEESLHPENQP